LRIDGSALEQDVAGLYAALERRGIRFRPHIWLSTEWFSPDGIPGIAAPFYVAHPRLSRLERRMRGEAEGANQRTRRRILFHEAGHAIDTAYGLRRRADWRAVFGRTSRPYPTAYSVRPASRRFVQHLGHWYAQSHPTEDFAETFAVWLQPKARWRREYAGWPALSKLEFVDSLMVEVAGSRATNRDRSRVATLADNRRTLREHYRRLAPATMHGEWRYDAWLMRAFGSARRYPGAQSASSFLREIDSDLRRAVTLRTATGTYLYRHVADTLRRRTRELGLVLRSGRREAKRTAAQLHIRVIRDLLRRNRERFVL